MFASLRDSTYDEKILVGAASVAVVLNGCLCSPIFGPWGLALLIAPGFLFESWALRMIVWLACLTVLGITAFTPLGTLAMSVDRERAVRTRFRVLGVVAFVLVAAGWWHVFL